MHVIKIVSSSVVILLITVLFAGAVTVPAAAQSGTMHPYDAPSGLIGTTLVVVNYPTQAPPRGDFAIWGDLFNATSGTPVANPTIQLQNSTDNATWHNVSLAIGDSYGDYLLYINESVAGTYYYRTVYAGNDTYASATSNVISELVPANGTTLTGAIYPGSSPEQNYTINGTLYGSGSQIAGATIQLQNSTDGIRGTT